MSIQIPEASSAPAKAYRTRHGAWVGGVSVGLAEHLGWPVLTVRLAFIFLGLVHFLGVAVYAVLWLLLPAKQDVLAPGLEAAGRTGMRQQATAPLRRKDLGVLAALVLFGLGLLEILSVLGMGMPSVWFWPVATACGGLALLWRQADLHQALPVDVPTRWFRRPQGWASVVRVVVGVALVAAAVVLVAASQVGLSALPQTLAVLGLALLGVGLIVAPWAYRTRMQLRQARDEKLLADQQADMAAHLHDSVLQTLALIQRQADDPKTVASLARRQERELRTWLYGDQVQATSLKSALVTAAGEIEDERGIKVECVVVGDVELDEDSRALVKAAREAMMNAAKHSGADLIDVYAEVEDGTIEVYIRDRGVGFDPDSIGADRQGVRRSILDRMERHHGSAEIRSAPGEGTEVRLRLHHE